MTTQLAQRRKGLAARLGLIAATLVAVAAVTIAIEYRALRPDLAAGPVLPNLAESIRGAQRINVVSSDASYRIERTQQGWAMRDRDEFPVLSSRLSQLTQGLAELRYTRRMTNDPAKHDRLGVTDPREGGRGVLVQIEDSRGALIVNLILGVEPGGGLYVRRPDEEQVWAARGELPPLREVAAWLDLRPLDISAERLVRVEIMPAEGRAYVLGRETGQQPWRILAPAIATLAQSTVNAAAERITQLAPVDVRTAPAIQGPPLARVRAITAEGVAIDAEVIVSDNRPWVKLVARAETPEQEAAALEINNRAAAWAFALTDMEADALAPPLSRLVPGAE